MAQDVNESISEFEKNRGQLMAISTQKQQLQVQLTVLEKSLEELGKTSEKKVYKAVGPILILSEIEEVKKDLSSQKESTDLRIKSFQKQEEVLMDKLNKLKHSIESASGKSPGAESSSLSAPPKDSKKGKSSN